MIIGRPANPQNSRSGLEAYGGTVVLELLVLLYSTQKIPTVDPLVLVKVGLLTPTVG